MKFIENSLWACAIALLANICKVGLQAATTNWLGYSPEVVMYVPPLAWLSTSDQLSPVANSVLWLAGNYLLWSSTIAFGWFSLGIPINQTMHRFGMLIKFSLRCVFNKCTARRYACIRQKLNNHPISLKEQFQMENKRIFVYNTMLVLCVLNLLPWPGADGVYLIQVLPAEKAAQLLPAMQLVMTAFVFLVALRILEFNTQRPSLA